MGHPGPDYTEVDHRSKYSALVVSYSAKNVPQRTPATAAIMRICFADTFRLESFIVYPLGS